MKRRGEQQNGRKSIFRALFAPLLIVMALQAAFYYFAAVYGGVEESLSQNAADVLFERLESRAYELETRLNNDWTNFDVCQDALDRTYREYQAAYGETPFVDSSERQIAFLAESSALLIDTLRQNNVNGVFLILNDSAQNDSFRNGAEEKYGLCIRDMDQESNYTGTEDLLLERAPSSLIDSLNCALDSWWEAKYRFESVTEGDYYYRPLEAAWQYPNADARDLLYCAGTHSISRSDPAVLSCSIPLITEDGYPYAVLGVELSAKYLSSLLPSRELNDPNKSCYVLALQTADGNRCVPMLGSGVLYNRCFSGETIIPLTKENATDGVDVTARGNVKLYGKTRELEIYNNNSPFEDRRPLLLAFVERDALFAHVDRVKVMLLFASVISLVIGVIGILLVSRRFAAPITALARRVRSTHTQLDLRLERVGVDEIDQLVDAIEELNRNLGKGSARTEFFSRMSHDMRTPMNAIIGFSSPELLEDASEAVKDDYLDKIHASGQYLLALINEVLDMTKIESNKTELHITTVRASALFDTCEPIIEKLAQKKQLVFTVVNDIPTDVFVRADVQHINQILMNLLSNAVKFTPSGGFVRLTSSLREEKDATVRLLITIADSGVGMSEAFQKHLYTPFEQENSRREGTGLGLSIAKKLVELMGGTIDCVSRQGQGTTFSVSLPLSTVSVADPEKPVVLPIRTKTDLALKGSRILVCEDNAVNMLIVRRLLEKWGVSVAHAENGKRGVELFAASSIGGFDAVLMDVRMPVMDGLEAARAIRALDRRDAKTVPIIAMTANAFEEDEQATRDAGMNVHLAKPVEPDVFFATLSHLLPAAHGEDA